MRLTLIYQGMDTRSESEREAIAWELAAELDIRIEQARHLLNTVGAALCRDLAPEEATPLAARLRAIGLRVTVARTRRF